MHPQRDLIEAAHRVYINEIALGPPSDPDTQHYDTSYHENQLKDAISKIKNTGDDFKWGSDVEAAKKKHHPMEYHAQNAAEHLADLHDAHAAENKKVSQDDIGDTLGYHFHSGYANDILNHHYSKYPRFTEEHMGTWDSHSDDFEKRVFHHLATTHGLMRSHDGSTLEEI